jgi:hypothetical protein
MRTIFLFILFLLPTSAFAWEPRIVEGESVVIVSPDTAQVFYDTLSGETRAYRFTREDAWVLDLSLLVPRTTNPKGKFDAVIVNESAGTVASVLEAGDTPWQKYYDLDTAEYFLRGPTLHQELPPGNYRIVVSSNENVGRYALLIGSKKEFLLGAIFGKVQLLPRIKKDFFDTPRIALIASPVQVGFAVMLLLCGVLVAFYARRFAPGVIFFRKHEPPQYKTKNIDIIGRSARFAIGLALLLFAMSTTWNPALFVVAGFSFYQAFASWCALFAFMGRSSCHSN